MTDPVDDWSVPAGLLRAFARPAGERDFCAAWLLARALGNCGGLSADSCLAEARRAYKLLQGIPNDPA